jgi:hypothetical protein
MVRTYRDSTVPAILTAEEVERVLATADAWTARGRRLRANSRPTGVVPDMPVSRRRRMTIVLTAVSDTSTPQDRMSGGDY